MRAFEVLLDNLGLSSEEDYLRHYGMDNSVPGICLECHEVESVEPDCQDGSCSFCGKDSIQSGLILLGLI